jgi:predicted Mrr-cat superfamily restriction endonuclease
MNVWRLITHHKEKDSALFWSRQNGRIAIGWGAIGNIRDMGYDSADDITAAIRRKYPESNNPHLGGSSLWDFYAQMQKDDLVILSASRPRVLVVEVEGDYEWTEESPLEGGYQHQRDVVIRRDLSPDDLWRKAGGLKLGQNN